MADIDKIYDEAIAHGFSQAAVIKMGTLRPRTEVRDMCAADKCRAYGHCWTCPPVCGSIESHIEQLKDYSTGLVVQVTGILDDEFDIEGMDAAGAKFGQLFLSMYKELRRTHPDMLGLGAGACRKCGTCTYPDEPCRFPEEALSSMEAFGLIVSDVCTANNLGYYYGKGTITYSGCYLFV